jgi:hypothetical protein
LHHRGLSRYKFRPARKDIIHTVSDVAGNDTKTIETVACLDDEINKRIFQPDLIEFLGIAADEEKPVQITAMRSQQNGLEVLDSTVCLRGKTRSNHRHAQ